jgi:DUF4097 and DUF4098 domain-containing protein YvlB
MSRTLRISFSIAAILFNLAVNADQSITRTFDGIQNIKLDTSSGDGIVRRSDNDQVTVTLNSTYDEDTFKPIIEQQGKTLRIREKFTSSRGWGRATWHLTVPDNLDLRFHTGSGDLDIEAVKINLKSSVGSGDVTLKQTTGIVRSSGGSGDVDLEDVKGNVDISLGSGRAVLQNISGDVSINEGSGTIEVDNLKGRLDADTGSGRMKISNSTGDMRLDTGSGKISLNAVTGALRVNAGSGDIRAKALNITGSSDFDSGSGDTTIEIVSELNHDIRIDTGSGNAILDFNGNPIAGKIEMRANRRHGEISAPFAFDKEFTEDGHYDAIMVKQASIGDKDIQITISTGSGTAKVKK